MVVSSPLAGRALPGRSVRNLDHRCAAGALIGSSSVCTMAFRFDSEAATAIIMGAGQNSSARIVCHRNLPSLRFGYSARSRASGLQTLPCGREPGGLTGAHPWLVGGLRRRGDNSHADSGTVDVAKGAFGIPRGPDAAAPMMRV